MKVIAYFLPQFHRIPENDKWWGEGFTEWTNTQKATPLFEGHYQPREPYNDLYYDLTNKEVRKWQIDIAKKYNIYGFCYYHYWLNGKQLLERPVNELLEMQELDMPFCICWANHTWNRSWTHQEKEILMAQTYGEEKEWEDHFNYLLKVFRDSRYIKIENKPVFLIYRPLDITHCQERLDFWNEKAKENGFDGIYFVETLHMEDPIEGCGIEGFNAAVEFEPLYTIKQPFSNILHYDTLWKAILKRDRPSNRKYFLGGFTGWDNTARKKEEGLVVLGSTPKKFGKYMKQQIKNARKINSDFIFINAWNEWAEGAYLEPDKKYAYEYLENIKDAIEHAETMSKDDFDETVNLSILDAFDNFIINNISTDANKILHVNCGTGILGNAIKQLTGVAVYGICKSSDEVKVAKNNLDFVIKQEAEQGEFPCFGDAYEHIILDKVFEQLDNPWEYLRKLDKYLKVDGTIFVRIPNIGNIRTLIDLMIKGEWTYWTNMSNNNNLRFYTLIEINEMLNLQGYKVKNIQREYLSLTHEEEHFIKEIDKNRINLQIWNADWIQEAKTECYLIEVRRKKSNDHSKKIKEIIKDEFEQLQLKMKHNIQLMIRNSDFENAKILIEECKQMYRKDCEFTSMRAVIAIIEEDFDYAEEILKEGLLLFEENFDLIFNLAYVYENKERYQLALDYYQKSLNLAINVEEVEEVTKAINKTKSRISLDLQVYKEVVFELAGHCNAHCKYCATGKDNRTGKRYNNKKYISIEEFKEAVAYLLENKIINDNSFFHLYNYGESFLNPDIMKILRFMEESGFSYGLSTNGSIPKSVDSYQKLTAMKTLKFSIPGFSQSSYDRIHGFNFNQIKDNIIKILKNYRDNGFEGIAILGFHVYQFNLKEIPDAVQFAKENNMRIELCNAYLAGYTMFKNYISSRVSYDELKEMGQELILHYLSKGEMLDFTCPQHQDIITIDQECNILTCCVVDRECTNYSIGNLFRLSKEEIKSLKNTQEICQECIELGIGYYSHNPIKYDAFY